MKLRNAAAAAVKQEGDLALKELPRHGLIFGLVSYLLALVLIVINMAAVRELELKFFAAIAVTVVIDVILLGFTFWIGVSDLYADKPLYQPRKKFWAEVFGALSLVAAAIVLLANAYSASKAVDAPTVDATAPTVPVQQTVSKGTPDTKSLVPKGAVFQSLQVQIFYQASQKPRNAAIEEGDRLDVFLTNPPFSEKDGFSILVAVVTIALASMAVGLKLALAWVDFFPSKKIAVADPLAPSPITPALLDIAPSPVTPEIPVRTLTPAPLNGPSPIIVLAFIAFGVLRFARPTRKPQSRDKTKKW